VQPELAKSAMGCRFDNVCVGWKNVHKNIRLIDS